MAAGTLSTEDQALIDEELSILSTISDAIEKKEKSSRPLKKTLPIDFLI